MKKCICGQDMVMINYINYVDKFYWKLLLCPECQIRTPTGLTEKEVIEKWEILKNKWINIILKNK